MFKKFLILFAVFNLGSVIQYLFDKQLIKKIQKRHRHQIADEKTLSFSKGYDAALKYPNRNIRHIVHINPN